MTEIKLNSVEPWAGTRLVKVRVPQHVRATMGGPDRALWVYGASTAELRAIADALDAASVEVENHG